MDGERLCKTQEDDSDHHAVSATGRSCDCSPAPAGIPQVTPACFLGSVNSVLFYLYEASLQQFLQGNLADCINFVILKESFLLMSEKDVSFCFCFLFFLWGFFFHSWIELFFFHVTYSYLRIIKLDKQLKKMEGWTSNKCSTNMETEKKGGAGKQSSFSELVVVSAHLTLIYG